MTLDLLTRPVPCTHCGKDTRNPEGLCNQFDCCMREAKARRLRENPGYQAAPTVGADGRGSHGTARR